MSDVSPVAFTTKSPAFVRDKIAQALVLAQKTNDLTDMEIYVTVMYSMGCLAALLKVSPYDPETFQMFRDGYNDSVKMDDAPT